MKEIELEILEGSRWEHFKKAKDMALIYPVGHPKLTRVQETLNDLIERINILMTECTLSLPK